MNQEDGTVPPNGWELPRDQEHGQQSGVTPEQMAQMLEQLLSLVPDELRLRLTDALRQLLEALRALIDWWVQRLERRPGGEVEVRDIPII